MKTVIELIEKQLSGAFEACGYEASYGRVTISNRPDLCEYQCNGAMAAAKAYKKAPIMIAEDVAASLEGNSMFEEITAVKPGFINIRVAGAFISDYIAKMAADEKLGCEVSEKPETIVIDYGGPNVAKPLHVGHLRSAIIGESLKRMFRFLGNTVIGDAHLGDWGLQMGLIIEEVKERQPNLCYFDESYTGEYPKEAPFTIGELEEIYPCASAKSKADPDFAKKAHDATVKLQQGNRGYTALWNHILEVSVADLKKNYKNLNVEFDLWKKESDAQPYIPDMVQMLKDKGLAYVSEGALVVDVKEDTDKKEIPPCLIMKSDGASLYQTTDLATIVERERLFHPDRIIYVVDKRQEMHFTQVFRVARKAKLVPDETKLQFLGFGTMNGKDGKPFKTREGGVMRLERLIGEIDQAVYEKMKENRSGSEEETREIAKTVGLAAIKYGDLSNQASKDYIFDVDRFCSFEGNTGPYILYMIVRIKSILKKYEEAGNSVEGASILPPTGKGEKDLMLILSRFHDTIEQAAEELAPHKICGYIYNVADAFSSFYHETNILAEPDKEKQSGYIALIRLVRHVLETCIDLLGFEAPDRM
ncbi:MAG TPA: arginine--tRNA ligase [Candidatus Fimimorpha excrementavium]|nr:arginine--tRNA ligase [Candidatus Fimimorpha excrementavium]